MSTVDNPLNEMWATTWAWAWLSDPLTLCSLADATADTSNTAVRSAKAIERYLTNLHLILFTIRLPRSPSASREMSFTGDNGLSDLLFQAGPTMLPARSSHCRRRQCFISAPEIIAI